MDAGRQQGCQQQNEKKGSIAFHDKDSFGVEMPIRFRKKSKTNQRIIPAALGNGGKDLVLCTKASAMNTPRQCSCWKKGCCELNWIKKTKRFNSQTIVSFSVLKWVERITSSRYSG